MKRDQLKSRIAATLVISLLLGAGIVLGTTALAQNPNSRDDQGRDRNSRDRFGNADQNRRGRNWDGYDNYGGSFQLRQTALNAGYNEGMKQGLKDRNKGNCYDYRNQSAYQKATKDYSSKLGDRELYRRYYREAYPNGYEAGINTQGPNGNVDQNRRGRNWDGYGNYGGSFQLRQTALNAGYNDGIKQGRNDRNKSNRSDYHYRDHSAYQKATKDYSSKLGDRELYRRYYRAAYPNGYDDGINGH
ncbi:MAG TPA: hypothetical protein VMM84_09395 [Pyrinomonadaceae bacterium]|nr:hypothetical protein [Pyrinomonadaceae bacterium]